MEELEKKIEQGYYNFVELMELNHRLDMLEDKMVYNKFMETAATIDSYDTLISTYEKLDINDELLDKAGEYVESRICKRCDGSGEVRSIRPISSTDINPPEWVICPECLGNGLK